MTPRNLLVAVVAVAIVAAAALLLLYAPGGDAMVDAARSTPTPAASDGATQPAEALTPIAADPAVTTSDERTEAVAADTSPGPLTHITGRCVDAEGAPLAGCKVRLSGQSVRLREAAWLREHTELPTWRDPEEIVTTADGRFAFAFWPPPPMHFRCAANCNRHVSVSASWNELQPGATVDLGDLVLAPGVQVHGRVVDTHGEPQAKTTVYLSLPRAAEVQPGHPIASRNAQADTDANGNFVTYGWLGPGEYSVSVQRIRVESPKTFVVSVAHPDAPLDIVVQSLADIPRITGRVLDMDGKPVQGAMVENDRNSLDGQQESYYAETRRDGTFDLRAESPPKGKSVSLIVKADDCECEAAPREIAWGTTDVEFRVVRGGELTVRVTNQQGRPVEHYTLRMIPRRQNYSSNDGRARSEGHHDDGVANVRGLKRGDWLVEVEFPEAAGYDLLFAPLQLEGPTSVRLDLVARPPDERPLRLLFADGKPAADTTVRLCDPFGQPMNDYRAILSLDHWHMNAGNPSCVLALSELRTDADGLATLRGPAGRDLVLELTSEHHLPQRLEGVRLDAATELTVRVSAGATLRGHAGPPVAFEELRRLAGLEPGAEFRDRPCLSLRATEGHAQFPPVAARMAGRPSPLQLADDGTFSAGGIPPGSWQVELHYGRNNNDRLLVGEVTLTDGTETEFDVDLSAILPGTLEATVRHNGAPLTNQRVLLICGRAYHNLFTDSEGHLTLRAMAGSYACRVELDGTNELDATAPAAIVRDETRQAVFELFSGRARLHLLDPDGKPVSQVRLMRRDTSHPHGYFLPITDVDGRVTLDLQPGHYTFHALPKKLTTQEGMSRIEREAREAGREDEYGPYLLSLGEVTLQANDDKQIELRLPEAWRQ